MKVTKLMSLAVVLCLAGVVLAQEDAPKKKERPAGIFGKINKVDGTKLVIDKRSRESKETTQVTVETDGNTKFTLDGAEADLSKMKEGLYVFITPETGTAQNVRAMTEMGRGGKGKDKGKGKDAPKEE